MNTDTVREQIVAGAARAAMCSSLQKMTVGDIAASAGISRATIYRHFAGGRDEIVSALVKSEFQRFLSHVAREAEQADSLEEMLVRGLTVAMPLAGAIDISAEKARLSKEIGKLDGEAKKIEAKLGNADFLTRAKEEVVEENRERLEDARAKIAKMTVALERLG